MEHILVATVISVWVFGSTNTELVVSTSYMRSAGRE